MLSAYLDGELSRQERAEVEAFLAGDAGARQLLAELKATVDGLKGLPRTQASDAFSDSIRSQLERRALLGSESPRRVPRVSAPLPIARRLAAAAVIALAVVASYVTWSFTREPERSYDRYAFRDESREEAHQERLRPSEDISPLATKKQMTQCGRQAEKNNASPMAMRETPKAPTPLPHPAEAPSLRADEAGLAPALADRDFSAARSSAAVNEARPADAAAAAPAADTMHIVATATQVGATAERMPAREGLSRGGVADDPSALPVLGPVATTRSAATQSFADARADFGYGLATCTAPSFRPSPASQTPTSAISVGIPAATQPASLPASQPVSSRPATSTAP